MEGSRHFRETAFGYREKIQASDKIAGNTGFSFNIPVFLDSVDVHKTCMFTNYVYRTTQERTATYEANACGKTHKI